MATTSSGTATVTLPTDEQILIVRDFDAPRALVWQAWTTPELVARWWHAKRGEMTVAEIDLRVGGTWRYAMVTEDGFEVAFHGEYREIVPNERLVNTEIYEVPPEQAEIAAGLPDTDPPLITTTFQQVDGRTVVTLLTECHSRELRDVIIESGMEEGLQEQMDLLDELAVSLG